MITNNQTSDNNIDLEEILHIPLKQVAVISAILIIVVATGLGIKTKYH